MKFLLHAALLLAASPIAIAADLYVDALNGDDTNSGASANDAWRTLTHAFGQVGGGDTLRVLPGTYDAAHGEVFPLVPPPGGAGLTVVGEAGAESTIVTGGTVFELDAGPFAGIVMTVEGLTLRQAVDGFRCLSTPFGGGCVRLTLRDVVLDRCTSGVHFRATNAGGICHLIRFEGVHVTGGFRGIDADHFEFSDLDIQVSDSTFEGTADAAIWCKAGIETQDDMLVERTSIVDCGDGIHAERTSSGLVTIVVADSLIAGCGNGLTNDYDVRLQFSTIADCTGVGVEAPFGLVNQSILYGNGQDIGPGSGLTVLQTNIGSGVVPGAGNISVDPLFQDADARDYRLGFGTDCVDAIGGITGTDLTGFPRGNDGDLDLVGARDMGALELRTLDMPETLSIGEKLPVDFHAELGTFSTLFLARTPQLPAPIATPFGDQWLPPGFLEVAGMQKALTSRGMRQTIVVPDDPGLVGMVFSFQALSRSSAAPMGAAWTDARTVAFTL